MARRLYRGAGCRTRVVRGGRQSGASPCSARHHWRAPPAGELRGAKTGWPVPSRRMKHAIRRLVLFGLATSALAAPAPAVAEFGTYTQYACRTPDGAPAPADGFATWAPGGTSNTCLQDGALSMT